MRREALLTMAHLAEALQVCRTGLRLTLRLNL